MITVMVYAVMLDKEYEFRFDPDVQIFELTEEIAEMICQKEQIEPVGNLSELMLFSKSAQQLFPSQSTLRECNVKTGDTVYFA